MKKFIVILLFVGLVVAAVDQKNGGEKKGKQSKGEDKKGEKEKNDKKCRFEDSCKNLTRPVNITMEECCPDIPKPLSWLAGRTCFAECGAKEFKKAQAFANATNSSIPGMPNLPMPQMDNCCVQNCTVFNYTTNGALDVKKIVAALNANITNNKDLWTSGLTTIVNNCIANASADLQVIKDKIAAENSTTAGNSTKSKNEKHRMGPQKESFLKKILACDPKIQTFFIVERCIMKKMFVNCPTKSKATNKNCTALYDYADQCPSFWAPHRMEGERGKGLKMDMNQKHQYGKPEKNEKLDKNEKKEQSGKPEKKEQGNKPEKKEQSGKPEKKEQGNKPEKKEQGNKPEKKEQGNKPEKKEQSGKPEKKEQSGKPEKKEQSGKPEKKEQSGKPEKKEQAEKPEKKEQSGKPEKKGQGPNKKSQTQAPTTTKN